MDVGGEGGVEQDGGAESEDLVGGGVDACGEVLCEWVAVEVDGGVEEGREGGVEGFVDEDEVVKEGRGMVPDEGEDEEDDFGGKVGWFGHLEF